MHTTPAPAARQPANRLAAVLALLSLVAGLFAPVALSLTVVLYHLAFVGYEPPPCGPHIGSCPDPKPPLVQLLRGVLATGGPILLLLAAAVVAIVSGHLALLRLRRHQPAPKSGQRVAMWGLILGYSAPAFLMAFYLWGLSTFGLGE
jgi:hypothetical protein